MLYISECVLMSFVSNQRTEKKGQVHVTVQGSDEHTEDKPLIRTYLKGQLIPIPTPPAPPAPPTPTAFPTPPALKHLQHHDEARRVAARGGRGGHG